MGEKDELDAVREAIKSKKLRWKAGPTSMSGLSKEDRKNMLGNILDKDRLKSILKRQEEKERKRQGSGGNPTDPPPAWDWRNVSGVNWMTPIKSQGGCGSCVAFGVIGALEMLLKKWTFHDSTLNLDLSEAHLFYCNNRQCNQYIDGDPNRPNPMFGWDVTSALDYLKANGVPDEDCYPYTDYNQPCNTCQDWNARIDTTKIRRWEAVTDINEMKRLLSEYGCLVADFAVYEDFHRHYTGGVYEHAYGAYDGGHCVAVVGYDDEEGCWIAKNSWGTLWGETYGGQTGWFRIAYGECGFDDIMYRMIVQARPSVHPGTYTRPVTVRIPKYLLKEFVLEPSWVVDPYSPRGILLVEGPLLKALASKPRLLGKVKKQFDVVLVPKTAKTKREIG
jgi:C1A family cysteine protease